MKNALALVLVVAACAPAPSSLQPEYGPVVQTSAQRPVLVASADVGAAVRSWYSQSLLQQPIIPGGGGAFKGTTGTFSGAVKAAEVIATRVDGPVGGSGRPGISFVTGSGEIDFDDGAGHTILSTLGSGTVLTPYTFSGTTLTVSGSIISTNSAGTSLVLGGTNNVTQNAKLVWSGVAPTVSSGFGVSPTIVGNNGTLAFQVNVGTGGAATSGVIGLPTAATGWICSCVDITTTSTTVFVTKQTASGTTSCTVGNFNDVASAAAWVASDKLNCSATAY